MRGRTVAVIGAAALVVGLSGCSTPSPPLLDSGFAGALARWCADTTAQGTGVVGSTATLWTWTSSTAQVRGQPSSGRAGIVFAPFGGPTDPDVVHARAVAECMDDVPLDWSLALDDSRVTRLRLYAWYRNVLMPCLTARNAPGRLPSRVEFVENSEDRVAPYTAIVNLDPATAAQLQAQCPPAPPDVLAEARLVAAANG